MPIPCCNHYCNTHSSWKYLPTATWILAYQQCVINFPASLREEDHPLSNFLHHNQWAQDWKHVRSIAISSHITLGNFPLQGCALYQPSLIPSEDFQNSSESLGFWFSSVRVRTIKATEAPLHPPYFPPRTSSCKFLSSRHKHVCYISIDVILVSDSSTSNYAR